MLLLYWSPPHFIPHGASWKCCPSLQSREETGILYFSKLYCLIISCPAVSVKISFSYSLRTPELSAIDLLTVFLPGTNTPTSYWSHPTLPLTQDLAKWCSPAFTVAWRAVCPCFFWPFPVSIFPPILESLSFSLEATSYLSTSAFHHSH